MPPFPWLSSPSMIINAIEKCDAGGLVLYVISDLPQRRLDELEADYLNDDGRIETMAIEIMINSEKWIFYSIYKQPKLNNGKFVSLIDDIIVMKCSRHGGNIMIVGDLNVNFNNTKHCLCNTIDLYGMVNIVRNPTCRKGDNASLLDIVLTNVPKRLQNVTNWDVGLSDFHDIVCFATKLYVPKRSKNIIKYRSYKKFDPEVLKFELSVAPFDIHVCNIFDDVDDSYWACERLITSIIDEHAPVKTRIIRHNNVPYMNGGLRKAMNIRNMMRRKYYKQRNNENWERHRQQRNHVVKFRKRSLNQYTREKCVGQSGTKEFWKVVKPLMSDKTRNNDCTVILIDEDEIINDQVYVCNVFNEYFIINMTKDTGNDDTVQENDSVQSIVNMYANHESIKHINDSNKRRNNIFNFKFVSTDCIRKILLHLNTCKATGFDNIPAKLLKLGTSALCQPLQHNKQMYNRM